MISPLACIAPEAQIGKNVTIHPFACIEKDVVIGDDCVIMPHASILNGTRLGKNNKVYHNAILGSEPQDFHYVGEESELIIGDNNSIRENVVIARATHSGGATKIGNENYIMEGSHLCHDVEIGNQCVIGINSIVAGESAINDHSILSSGVTIHQYCTLGSWVVIQGGCRISKDVPPYVIMNGNPATYHGVNSVVLNHYQFSERVIRHIIAAYRLIYQGNFSIQDAVLKIKDQIPMSEEIQNIADFINASKRGIVK